MPKTLAAAALALLCACGHGYTNGSISLSPDGGPALAGSTIDGGGVPADAGAGRLDAGFDGGCVAATISGVAVTDGCNGGQKALGATINVSGQSCAASITSPTGIACSGTADGGSNAFTGVCNAFTGCASSSLPGTIVCSGAGSVPCAIVLSCDGGCH